MDKYSILFIAIFIGILSFFLSEIAFLFLVFSIISYLIYKNTSPEDRRFVLTVFITGFLFRVILAVGLHVVYYVKGWEGFTSGDDLLYSLKSWALVYGWEGKFAIWKHLLAPSPGHGVNPFTYLLAFFYKLFGFHPLSAKFINCIIGSLIGWISYIIGKEIFDNKTAKVSILIVTFYPSLVRWSVANLKDPLIILLFLSCIYILIKGLSRKIKLFDLVIFMLLSSILYNFASGLYFIIVMCGAGIFIFFRFLNLLKNKKLKMLTIFTVIIFILGCAYYFLHINPNRAIQFIYKAEYFQKILARSDYAGYYLYTSNLMESLNKGVIPLLEFSKVTLKNCTYFMLTPFPWKISSRTQVMAYPQMLSWYFLLFLSIFGLTALIIKKPKTGIFIIAILIMGIVPRSMIEGNIGAAFRHRDFLTPIFIILASKMLKDLVEGVSTYFYRR